MSFANSFSLEKSKICRSGKGRYINQSLSIPNHLVIKYKPCSVIRISPFPKRQLLDFSKLKEFADDNLNFDENIRKLSKRVENSVGKGEIARYEQFLLFPQCFQKTCTADT